MNFKTTAYSPLPIVVMLFLICTTSSFDSAAENDELVELSNKILESYKREDTAKVIEYLGDVNHLRLDRIRLAARTSTAVTRFTDPVSRAMNIMEGEGVLLKEVNQLIERETDVFKKSYQFETLTPKDYGLSTEILESLDSESQIAEYARVSRQAASDIKIYTQEIESLKKHRQDLEELIRQSEKASEAASDYVDFLENLNEKNLSALTLGQSDLVWLELKLYTEDRLALRTAAIQGALDRMDARLTNLVQVRDAAKLLQQNVDFFWWYEVIRQQLKYGSGIPGAEELDTSAGASSGLGSTAQAGLDSIKAKTYASGLATKAKIEQLEAQARSLAADNARLQQISSILNLISSGTSLANQVGSPDSSADERSSDANNLSLPIDFEPSKIETIVPPPARIVPPPKTLVIPQSLPKQPPVKIGPYGGLM